MTHWHTRLNRLAALDNPNRAQRRQLRKLIGRRTGLEWRTLGHQKDKFRQPKPMRPDALASEIVHNARTVGHIARVLEEKAKS